MLLRRLYTILTAILISVVAKGNPYNGRDSIVVTERQDTLKEARITSDKVVKVAKTQTGHKHLNKLDFIYGNVVFSSPDIIKSLQNLPGVSAGTELMSGLYVHGGEGSDNLFLLDGVPMYQISHLGGIFSSFNTDVVNGLDFYKSGFPARYGGRMSSVVDINTKDGDYHNYHGSFMIGLIDGRLQFEGPIVKGKTSFNIALRRSWMDAVLAPTIAYLNKKNKDGEVIGGNYAFHDLNASITHKFSDRDKVSLKMYYGRDRLRLNQAIPEEVTYTVDNQGTQKTVRGEDHINMDISWGNLLASLNWYHVINDNMHLYALAYYSGSDADVWYKWKDWRFSTIEHYDAIDETNVSTVSDIAAKANLDWRVDNHHIGSGISYQHHIYHPKRYSAIDNDGSVIEEESGIRYSGDEMSVYAEDEITLWERLNFNAGLRYVIFSVPGKFRHKLEPRIALSYRCTENLELKASYTHMNQFAHMISTHYLDVPTNCWLPSTESIEPMYSKQVAAGIYSKLPKNIRLNVEAYYKTMDNLLEYAGSNTLFL